MVYYLELRIHEFIDPNDLDEVIRKPLAESLKGKGRVTLAMPEYQFYQSANEDLPKLNIGNKVLFFKYIKVTVSLLDLAEGASMTKAFLESRNLQKSSKLLFADERYNLLEIFG
jgi:hypothetical protein